MGRLEAHLGAWRPFWGAQWPSGRLEALFGAQRLPWGAQRLSGALSSHLGRLAPSKALGGSLCAQHSSETLSCLPGRSAAPLVVVSGLKRPSEDARQPFAELSS